MARILVVDDDALVRDSVRLALQSAGHEVIAAENGRRALALLDGPALDLIVSDILMPELDGLGLVRAVRARLPDLPILCISGGGRHATMDFLPVARELGASQILAKPFTPKQLLASVDALLRSSDGPMPPR